MRKLAVSDNELIHLFEMCMDAEERCERRYYELLERGNHDDAAYEAQTREKYVHLKHRIFQAMKDGGDPSALEQITQFLRSIGQSGTGGEISRA